MNKLAQILTGCLTGVVLYILIRETVKENDHGKLEALRDDSGRVNGGDHAGSKGVSNQQDCVPDGSVKPETIVPSESVLEASEKTV